LTRLGHEFAPEPRGLPEDRNLKLELNDQERRAVGRSLAERKARLIESVGDTTRPPAARRAGLLELAAIASLVRKLGSRKSAENE
jgi:hypothetical protein